MIQNETTKWREMTFHGDNHFSKRRRESEKRARKESKRIKKKNK
jgi:hypothetical protein